MITFENVSKQYSASNVSIENVDLTIKKGEFVTIIGHSGAGKTSLMKLLLAEQKPNEGTITFDGVNIHRLRKSDIPHYRQRIGVIFQDYKLLKGRTVFENIAFAMEMVGKSNNDITNDVPNALELVGLEELKDRFPTELSGGEQQRLAIARAIINQPDILIADEPTDSLDPENVKAVVQILKKINELGTTVILVTHNMDVVKEINERVVVMEKGTIIKDQQTGKKKK